jgi:hypothetical protein
MGHSKRPTYKGGGLTQPVHGENQTPFLKRCEFAKIIRKVRNNARTRNSDSVHLAVKSMHKMQKDCHSFFWTAERGPVEARREVH